MVEKSLYVKCDKERATTLKKEFWGALNFGAAVRACTYSYLVTVTRLPNSSQRTVDRLNKSAKP